MKLPVLITYKETDDFGKELKYALRSLDNIINWNGEVFLAGDKPSWIKNVIHIQPNKTSNYRLQDVEYKIEAALKDKRLPEYFILSMDDVYVTEKTVVGVYQQGPLEQTRNTLHHKCKAFTADYLRLDGYREPVDYELHTPMVMNKSARMLVSRDINPSLYGVGLLSRSVYYNKYGIVGEFYQDKKTYDMHLPKGKFISTQMWTPELKRLFPNKSRFEK